MSLQVWLPLNGDLHNQGLANLPAPVVNTLTYENGKIGKCGIGRVAWHLSEDILNNAWSVAIWVKSSSTYGSNNNVIFCKNTSASTDCQIYFSIINGTSFSVGVNGPSSSISQSFTFTLDVWNHLAATYDGNTVAIYINGELKKTAVVTTAFPTGRMNLTLNGRSTNAAGTGVTGQLDGYRFNDFRLYNHALSAKEVKEIAKGLVLHYKLDNNGLGNSNLLSSIDSTIIDSTASFEFQGWVQNFYTKTWVNNNLTPGKTYTLSYTVTCISIPDTTIYSSIETRHSPILVHQGGGWSQTTITNDNIKTTNMQVGQSRHYICTFTFATATENQEYYGLCGYTCLYRNPSNSQTQYARFRIDNLKLEEGSVATPWSPNPADLSLNTNIIYDSSGYEHHAIPVGAIAITNPSPRYAVATAMNNTGTSNHIEADPLDGLSDNIFTVSFWVKAAKSTNQVFFADPKVVIGTLNSLIYPFISSTSGFSTTHFINNEWNHIVVIKNNTSYYVYINGEAEAQNGAKNYYMHGASQLWLLNRSNNNYAANATISDVRVYCTTLSADDVKELYNTSASIDNKGNVYAREVVEI